MKCILLVVLRSVHSPFSHRDDVAGKAAGHTLRGTKNHVATINILTMSKTSHTDLATDQMFNNLIQYNLFQATELSINQMVKISFTYENSYRWSLKQFTGPMTEHIWCKILEFLPNDNLVVLVSNNCYFSSSPDINPLKYQDKIIINISNIKDYKIVNPEIYNQQADQLVSNLSPSIISILKVLSKEEVIKFLEAYLSKQKQ